MIPAALPAAPAIPEAAAFEARALGFTAGIFLMSLLGQRFGLVAGASWLSVVVPLGLGLTAWHVTGGVLVLHRVRLIVFAALVACVLLGAAIRTAAPSNFGGAVSWPSLFQLLLLSGFAALSFAAPVDERRFFGTVNACLAVVAVAGVAQFALQFAGLPLFSFAGLVPDAVLIEPFFNTAIPIGDATFKSNGLTLLEPSVFSQFMALALLIEVLALRRPRFLALFGAGLVCSVSGTGWLMIGGFVPAVILSLGGAGLLLAAAVAALAVLALGGLAVAVPDAFDALASRVTEFELPGSSGHLRFVTPWWLARDVLALDPLAWLAGIGAGVSENLGRVSAYDYNVNPPVKILLEFGLPALLCYLLLLTLADGRTRAQRALVLPVLVMILLSGGYQQQAFILFPTLLVVLVARLRPSGPAGGPAPGSA